MNGCPFPRVQWQRGNLALIAYVESGPLLGLERALGFEGGCSLEDWTPG